MNYGCPCMYIPVKTCFSFKAENGILPPFPTQLTFFAKSVEKMWASNLLTFAFKFSPPIVDKDLTFIIKFQRKDLIFIQDSILLLIRSSNYSK